VSGLLASFVVAVLALCRRDPSCSFNSGSSGGDIGDPNSEKFKTGPEIQIMWAAACI
jgi:hypothetical protein